MISISLYNQKNDETPLVINKELLQSYRKRCDTYLVNIKRELTKSLVDYKLFQELQQVNNSFFVIIDYLDCEHYTYLKELEDDKTKLITTLDVFTKHCKLCVALDSFEVIIKNCNYLVITIHKLIQIIKSVNEGV